MHSSLVFEAAATKNLKKPSSRLASSQLSLFSQAEKSHNTQPDDRIKFFEKQIDAVTRISSCPSCNGDNLALAPGKGIHTMQLRCVDCDRWLKWISKSDISRIAAIAAQAKREGVELP